MSRSTIVIELADDAQFSADLAAGGVFVPGCALSLTEECDLVVCGANHQVVLPARVVYVDEHRGAGLELIGFSSEMKAQLAELEPVVAPELASSSEPAIDNLLLAYLANADPANADPANADLANADPANADPANADLANADLANADPANADTVPPGDADEHDDDANDQGDPGSATRSFPRNVHERLRGLTLVAQVKVAISGELHERIVLERLYGKNVWETLLRNPRLTAPEVARIARYGTLPRVLLEIIVGNNTWLQVPEVRRALLSNPRLATDQFMKVLRLLPKHELKLAAIQTAYPFAVRNAAKMMMLREA